MRNFPKQRTTYSEKTANNYKLCKQTIDSLLLNYAHDSNTTSTNNEWERKLSNYQLYNNIINQKDLEKECNPLNLEVGQFKDEIQPYNKTYNKIQVLLGDELRRPFNYKAVLTNSDGIKSKLAYKDVLFRNYLMSSIQETLNSLNVNVGEDLYDPNILMDPKEIDRYMSMTYLDAKEVLANKLLKYLEKELAIKELKNDSFKHGLISGEEFVYVDTRNGQPHLEVLNPLGVFFHKSPEVKYVQDGLYAGYRTFMTTGDVLDNFGQYLSEKEVERIDQGREGLMNSYDNTIHPDMRYYQDSNYYDSKILNSNVEASYSGGEDSLDE